MSKIAVVTDSNSGLSLDQAKELGVSIVPTPFMINGETFFQEVSLTREEFYKKLSTGADISTSQPSPDSVMTKWDELLKEYDEIVHIPISSGLSTACDTATVLAQDYDGKVQVVNNQRVSVTQRQSVIDAVEMAKLGKSAAEIKKIMEDDKFNSSIYIMIDTLYYLKKGGRITPAAAALGTLLKLKPVLQIQGEKLDAFAKARTVGQAKTIMINAVKSDIEKRFGGISKDNPIDLSIAHTENEEAAKVLKAELQEVFPDYPIYIDHLSLSVACHIGPGSLAVACSRRPDVLR
jgi:DegV family protein with EDD domain